MAGTGQGLFVGVAVLGMVALGWTANAEPIPLPAPAPLPKERAAPPSKSGTTAQSGGSGLAAGVRSLFHLDKEPEASPTPVTTTAGFTPTQRAQVDKVSAYLSNMQQLVGDFVQLGPDGSRVRGEFYIQKPGKVRFEYEPHRDRRRRSVGRGSRPQACHAGSLSALADAAALPPLRAYRSSQGDERHRGTR